MKKIITFLVISWALFLFTRLELNAQTFSGIPLISNWTHKINNDGSLQLITEKADTLYFNQKGVYWDTVYGARPFVPHPYVWPPAGFLTRQDAANMCAYTAYTFMAGLSFGFDKIQAMRFHMATLCFSKEEIEAACQYVKDFCP